ncbi:MAG: enoyl-CoA hydratase/isomerase family protein [Dongiaceae bacterium]
MSDVLYQAADGVATIALNRPARLNAMTEGLVEGLAVALERAAADDAVRAILLRGEGRAFCAGDDLKEFEGQVRSAAGTHRYLTRIQDTARMMVLGRKPVVAAAQGWAAGGGLEWLINSDFVIMAEGTRCFFPEVSLGFIVTGGITQLLPRMVGMQRAKALIMLGEKFDAAEALALGIAWKVVPPDRLLPEAEALARRLAALPANAVADLKRVMARAEALDFEALLELERDVVYQGFLDPETADRVRQAAPNRT